MQKRKSGQLHKGWKKSAQATKELRGPMVKTSEMVERVAKAIAKAQGFDAGEHFDGVDVAGDWPNEFRFEWRELARAAIEAMRKPTEAMIFAAETHDPDDPWYTPPRAWPKMIDVALSDA